MRSLTLGLFGLAALVACGGGATQSSEPRPGIGPTQEQPKPVPQPAVQYGALDLLAGLEQQTLDNGMKVFVKEDRRLPVVSTALVYRVGTVHEPEGTSGLAHFLEHMLFKGTDIYAKGEIDEITVRAGGVNNAFTENDFTLYWFNVAAEALDDVLRIEASRMRNCTLDLKEMDGERGNILSELYRFLDSPSGKLQYEMDQIVFKTHSYRRPGHGYEADVKSVKLEVMREFYLNHYGPNNAALVVIGDIDRAKTFARVRELFNGIPKVKEAAPPTAAEPPQKGENRATFETDKATDRIGLAWRTNTVGSEEDIVLDVIQNLLTNGKDSRLYKRFVVRDRVATEVDATNSARRYDGVFYVFSDVTDEAKPADVEKALLEELESLKAAPVAARELQKARNIITANFIFGKESALDLATSVGVYEGLGVPRYLKEYIARIEAVTPQKIQAVAKSLFRVENRTVAVANKARNRRHAGRQAAPASPVAEFGEYHEHRLANGLTILIKPRRNLPIVSVVASVDAGPLTESSDKAGVAQLTGALLDQGFSTPDLRKMGPEEIAEALEYTGAQLSAGSEGLSAKCLTRDSAMVMDLLRDLLIYPVFPDDRVALYLDHQLQEIEGVGDDPSGLARELWFSKVYSGHPAGRPGHGLKETVEKLTRADVVAHHAARYRPDTTILAVTGDVDPAAILHELTSRFGSWSANGPAAAIPLPDVKREGKGHQHVEFRKTKQINVCLGHVSIPFSDPDYFALRVFEQIFCSSPAFTDRLTRIVREDMHLAYEVGGAVVALAPYPAPFLVYMGSGSQNGMKARDTALKILNDLLTEGPKEGELLTAKAYLTRSIPFRWESTDDVANYMVTCRRRRLGIDWPLRYRAGVSAVTKEDVLRAARAHLNPDALTTVIVGPVDKDGNVIEEK